VDSLEVGTKQKSPALFNEEPVTEVFFECAKLYQSLFFGADNNNDGSDD